ncbi:MAG: adenosylmethionine-8-amino-7-oxononanoate aminotransferase [Candidatus Schekmanbacteria bacterium RIFCSPLOWO2_12_FULL_38_15]|uniref:Adenosylmethionine-8-amino-7-oxononanoate aminotransferase n=1 Tax=Candidatus Schekmanbacteria bacterium RIFCSPLOWO2_12_FULL_38_15 TaxID=1817883 RepID=A0A1F7SJB9_9BACT|nr:MAG: adenosylmethionine-8-amino-7-oxononanoate aminotransferase [Candidatus Schekmanbacteria bacterium RIFCSPLOWO2_12_FULL_38_15]
MESRELTEKELLEIEAKYCSFGDTVHYLDVPKIFKKCKGSWLFDMKDKPYLDMQMWYSAVSFGYKNEEIENLYNKQMSTLPQLASQYLHKEKILLASAISKETEKRFGTKGRVHFNVGGAQAIEDSLKLVRNYKKGKSLMFAFMGGYHGRTLAASEITSSYRYRRRYGHFSNRAFFVPFPYCYRCFYDKNRNSCKYECIKQFEKHFETEYYGIMDLKEKEAEYAAFFIEPLQATGGYIVPPPEYFGRLSKILKKYGILIVDDEIQMGFYRTGKMWAMEHFNVKPDVIAFAKALTNGLNPLSGLWAKEELINPKMFPPGSTHSTFSSNPLGTAAGLATMRFIEKNNFEKTVKGKGNYIISRLKKLQKKYKVIGDVDGLGLAIRIELTKSDRFTPDRELTDRIFQEGMKGDIKFNGKKYGLVLDVGGYYKNVFTLAPALTITDDEMDLFITLFESLIKRCVN